MLALIAGTGALPAALVERLQKAPLICAVDGYAPTLPVDISFRIEHLGSFLNRLKEKGIDQICMAGAVRRPTIEIDAIDSATRPLVPMIQTALTSGDDGALRAIIAVFEDQGFDVVAAHTLAPDLLPEATAPMGRHEVDARIGASEIALMGVADIGQACVVQRGQVIAREGPEGTDAMLSELEDVTDAILFKAPKPQQDRRADLPLIGPETARLAVSVGLAGIVIEAGGVMVLDHDEVVEILNAHGLFLWVRP